MEKRFICKECKSTFTESRIKVNAQDVRLCPVCSAPAIADITSHAGMYSLKDVLNYEVQSYNIRRSIEDTLADFYKINPNRSWDIILTSFLQHYAQDKEASVEYKVGENYISDLRLALKVEGWRVILAIDANNRVYIKDIYPKNDLSKI